MGEETAHLMQERNRERKVGVRIPSRPCPQWPNDLPWGPTF
jgi:hypothetical protein